MPDAVYGAEVDEGGHVAWECGRVALSANALGDLEEDRLESTEHKFTQRSVNGNVYVDTRL